MEEIGTTNPKYHPQRVYWHPFVCPHSKTIPLAPINPFTKQIVPSLCPESFTQSFIKIVFTSFLQAPYKVLPTISYIFMCTLFLFSCFFLSFASRTFSWACRSLCEPWKFFSFCAFTCLSNNSLTS